VYYGIGLLSPTWFFIASAAICALVGMITGSSWTTAGTLGVAFVGMANVLGLSEAVPPERSLAEPTSVTR
jgi:NhaC family Na+:H+ antiporter